MNNFCELVLVDDDNPVFHSANNIFFYLLTNYVYCLIIIKPF